MSSSTAEERLIALATDIGLRKALLIVQLKFLQDEFAQNLCRLLLQATIEDLGEMTAPEVPNPPKRLPAPKHNLLGSGVGATRLEFDGEYTIMHLPDGRMWRSRRTRDLVLRARKAGFSIET